MGTLRGGVKGLHRAVFDAPEPSWRGFFGYSAWIGVGLAAFGVYDWVWQLIVVGVAMATVALPAALWLQARERTDVQVELPPIGIHSVYPIPILGGVLLVAGISVGDLKLAGLGIVVMAFSGGALWLAWRRRRRFGA